MQEWVTRGEPTKFSREPVALASRNNRWIETVASAQPQESGREHRVTSTAAVCVHRKMGRQL